MAKKQATRSKESNLKVVAYGKPDPAFADSVLGLLGLGASNARPTQDPDPSPASGTPDDQERIDDGD